MMPEFFTKIRVHGSYTLTSIQSINTKANERHEGKTYIYTKAHTLERSQGEREWELVMAFLKEGRSTDPGGPGRTQEVGWVWSPHLQI